jgi:hypothetical protein
VLVVLIAGLVITKVLDPGMVQQVVGAMLTLVKPGSDSTNSGFAFTNTRMCFETG